MLKKMSMKKKMFLLSFCLLVATGVGSQSVRKYLKYFKSIAVNSFQKNGVPSRDSASVALLQLQYTRYRDSLESERQKLAKEYLLASTSKEKSLVLEKARTCLKRTLVEKIYPSWYGTEWDFNGITETPYQGKIACGYFVSTTLKHTGMNINRYKLAQKYSHAIVKSVCTDVKIYSGFAAMITKLKSSSDDVYVVGLDNHVGIINKQGEEIQFIHSSYIYPSYVLSESAENSAVLGGSNIYVLGNMTSNDSLLRAWLTGMVVKVLD